MSGLPSGTVTFLFTDIEDSTRLLIELGRDQYVRCLTEHDALLRGAIVNAGGIVVKPEGGAFFAVFTTAPAAIVAVVEAQRLLQHHSWPSGADVRVRMGVHTGTGTPGGDDYVGIDVHRAARIASVGFGGQILLSAATAAIVRPSLPDGVDIDDLGEHRLKDLDAEPLFQLLIAGLVSKFPPLATASINPTNLPNMPTSFVGRGEELDEVSALISESRLVTLSGVAGAGKTRLALKVAATLGDRYPDGVWFVDLSAVTDSDLVATEAAYAVGVQERQGRSIDEVLFEHLARREALLVIDNCEHLIAAAADLIDGVLRAAPLCRVIATTRELLRIGGEVAYRLRPMSLPEDVSNLGLLEIGRYDAVRLFVERASEADRGFSITEETAQTVARICHQMDGMPLAIELAAAQLRSSTLGQVADHLDGRFQTLDAGFRSSVPRQQTLAAAIDWSYQLLESREQTLFCRLSVFHGGFDMDAAQQVCAGDPISTFEVFGLVSALVDKSLIVADVSGDVARYRLPDMLRQFAADRLEEKAATGDIRRHHARYFVGLAEEAEQNVRGEKERDWRQRIETEQGNFGAAMSWSIDVREPEIGMRLAGAIWRYWKDTFHFSEGVRWLGTMYSAGQDADMAVRAKVMLGLGTLMSYTDSPGSAGEVLEGAIEIYRDLESQGAEAALLREGYSSAVISLATNIWQYDQDYGRATELWSEALKIARRIDDDAGVSLALGNLAEAAARAGDIEAARAGYTQGIEASHALNSRHRTVEAIVLFAVFEMSIDEPGRAVSLLDEATELARSDDLPFWVDFSASVRAVAAHDLGESRALEHFVEHASRLFADHEFRATFYYQLPLILARADLEHSAGHSERAAVLLGVLEELEHSNSPLEPIFEGTRRGILYESLTAELGEPGFADAVARGRVLPYPEAVAMITTG